MGAFMPSPIGHALAGVALSLVVPEPSRSQGGKAGIDWKRAGLCAVVAALPDLDLLYRPIHRTVTHSIPVAILFTIIAVAVTGWVTRSRRPAWWATGLAIGLAWASHVLLDWLGADANPPYGIQMFWPFSERWYFSGWNVFPGTERRDPLGGRAMLINLRAALVELGIMGSIAMSAWAARTAITRTRRSRGPTFDRDGRPQPFGGAAGTGDISDRQDPRAGR